MLVLELPIVTLLADNATPLTTAPLTKAVLAACNVFVPAVAVGTNGTPVNVGLAKFAFKANPAITALLFGYKISLAVKVLTLFDFNSYSLATTLKGTGTIVRTGVKPPN